MEAKEVIELFDSYWFEIEILKNQSNFTNFESNPDPQIEGESERKDLFRAPSMISRSMSDQLWPEKSLGSGFSMSPDSVLTTGKLQTILSGKETTDEEGEFGNHSIDPIQFQIENSPKKKGSRRRRRPEKKKLSKSLSELEFEEVKGFMDLGFVFSEEDKDSNLISIIPGLQRLGKKENGEEEDDDDNGGERVSRPYLSEAWENFDKKKKKVEPLMNWRIPAISNEIDMKENIKFWAQTVAYAVR